MDEKARAKTETEAAQREALAQARARRSARWVKPAIAVAVLATLGWGFFLGLQYVRFRSESSGPAAPAAPAPTPRAPASAGSLAQSVEVKSALEAYKPYLKVYDVSAAYEEDLLEGDVPVVRGKVENDGERTLAMVEITAYFLDANGQRIHETKFPIVGAPLNLLGGSPLRPGYIQPFEFPARDTPSEWSVGQVECEVTAIRFGD